MARTCNIETIVRAFVLTLLLGRLSLPCVAADPPPLTREAIWQDPGAELVFAEDFSDPEKVVLKPPTLNGERFRGVIEGAGPDGENAYAIDFDLPAGATQTMNLAMPPVRQYGIYYRFLLKVEPRDPADRHGLALRINGSAQAVSWSEPLEKAHVKTSEWLDDATRNWYRPGLEYVYEGWVLYEGDTAFRRAPDGIIEALRIDVLNRSEDDIRLRVSLADIRVIRRDIYNLPEMQAVLNARHPFLMLTREQIELARSRIENEPEMFSMSRWMSQKLRRAELWLEREDPFRVTTVQGAWPGARYCSKQDCRGRLRPDPPEGFRCEVCGDGYTGENFTRLLAYNDHVEAGQTVRALGFAWQWTGLDDYAERAAEILLAYAEAISGFRLGHNWLGDCWLLEDFIFGYDYIHEWMTAEDRHKINDDFLREQIRRIYHFNHHYPEGQARIQRVLAPAAMMTGDKEWIHLLLFSPGGNRNVTVRYGLTGDMVSTKGPAYNRGVLQAIIQVGPALENLGIKFFDESIKGIFDIVASQVLPDISIPAFGHGNVGAGSGAYGLNIAYRYYRDNSYLPMLSERWKKEATNRIFWENPDLPEAGPLQMESSNLTGLGLTVLRSRPDSRTALALNWGSPKRNDPGRLDFQLYGAGGHLIWSSGITGYANPFYGSWYTRSLSRNVPVINEGQQGHVSAPQVYYDDRSDYAQVASVRLSNAFNGDHQLRTAFLFDDGDALLVDLVSVSEESVIDWVIHLPGDTATDVELEELVSPFGDDNGYGILAENPVMSYGSLPGEITLRHSRPGPERGVRIVPVTGASAVFYLAKGRTGYSENISDVALFRHDGVREMAFAALMQPFSDQKPTSGSVRFLAVDVDEDSDGASVIVLDVETGRGQYRVRIETDADEEGHPYVKDVKISHRVVKK